ncbi:MAG: DUF692 family protein [Alphaproteobacteria bacterium]|nr:DUF692 family protein [Alphaproteobacteria bacterium]MCB9699200.1 DUF692 family protein [Alphaproteobacteria bacterium]
MSPRVGVSWMPTAGFRAAVEPVLETIEAVEQTVDQGFEGRLPASAEAVFTAFAEAGQLYGHAVGASVLSAGREDVFDAFLLALRRTRRPWVDLSDHYGFCTAGAQRFGAPLPLPRHPDVLAVGRERLVRLREAAGCPVGLENLALALCAQDALDQGPMVAELLQAVDGFVHLDLHNLWCQLHNFELDADVLLASWPLERVWRVHVSGGSFVDDIRRDTHDHRVPDEVWALLRTVLPRLPACRALILEQLPSALLTEADQQGYREDLALLRAVRDEVCGVG